MNRVTLINRLGIKPGKIDEFIAAQRVIATTIPVGLLGGRLYRSTDGQSVILIAQFESMQAQEEIRAGDAFKEQLKELAPLVESSTPTLYEEAYTYGDFQ